MLVIFATIWYDLYVALFNKYINYCTVCTLVYTSNDLDIIPNHQL